MKKILENPIFVQLEIGVVNDIIKIIEQSISKHFSFGEINLLQNHLNNKIQEAIKLNETKKGEENATKIG